MEGIKSEEEMGGQGGKQKKANFDNFNGNVEGTKGHKLGQQMDANLKQVVA